MLNDLIQGYQRYRTSWSETERELYHQLVREGQAPKVMIVACCDSRVDPSTILGAGPGSLFTVRNVGNLIPPYEPDGAHHGTSAALEYAVRRLKVEHIIVMGHAHCGGIRALLEEKQAGKESDFILSWMRIVAEARNNVCDNCGDASHEAKLRMIEQEAIRVSLDNLLTFGWIKERVEAGTLTLHGWYYALAEGLLMARDPVTNKFRSLLGNGGNGNGDNGAKL